MGGSSLQTRNRGSGLLLFASIALLAAMSLGPRLARLTPERVDAQPASAHFVLSDGRALLDVNAATAAELEELPEIGPVLAGRILEYREAHGAFSSVDQLTDISGIGAASLERIRPFVTASTGAPGPAVEP